MLGVSEKSHEDDVEQMPCPVPIRILDHMKVTTDSQFELDDQFMPSLNSIKSSIAPHSTVIKGHTEQLPTTIAGCITTKAHQAIIDVQLGTNGENLMIDQPISNNEQTPLPTRRNRRPGPYNTSPYLTNCGSSAGTIFHFFNTFVNVIIFFIATVSVYLIYSFLNHFR